MLKGLEVRISNFSHLNENKDFRIDSQFYTKEPIKNEQLVYKKIGDCLLKAQYGISISMNEDSIGTPIYRMNEIHNMLCDVEVSKCANIDAEEKKTFLLNDRDVLFNRTNSFEWVGRTGLYKKQQGVEHVFASYLVRFIPDPSIILPEYLVAFLSSSDGTWDVKRRARQSINQTNVNPEEVKAIEIPLFSMDFQNKIKNCFDSGFEQLSDAEDKYEEAANLLNSFTGFSDYSFSDSGINIKSFSSSFGDTGRLDAEYFQPKFEEIIDLIQGQAHCKLSDIVTIKKSIEPGSACYSDKGLPFMRVSDYDKFNITTPAKNLSVNYTSKNRDLINGLKPKKGTILFSKDGSVGLAYQVREDLELITSGAILHLEIKDETELLPEYLTLVLNSPLVKMQAERDAGGSIILHWRLNEIENVVIPIIPMHQQIQIVSLINESFNHRVESSRLLSTVTDSVEIGIRENETSALNHIDSKVDFNA